MRSTLQQLTHDLRQPLSVIESSAYYLEMILSEDDTVVRTHLQRIREQVEMASRLLNECQEPESRPRTNAAMASVTY
jgi:signal transduction histidine kinase